MRSITVEEALLMFNKLESEDAEVICFGSLWGWKLTMLGKIRVEGEAVVLVAPGDRKGGLTLRLRTEDLFLWYSEPGDFPPDERSRVPENMLESVCVSASLPLRLPLEALADLSSDVPPRREKLFFCELKEGAITE